MRDEQIPFMGTAIDNITMAEALDRIKDIVTTGEKMYVVTPNVDHIVKLQDNDKLKAAYANAGMVAVDGTPIMIAAHLYKTPFKEKLTGPRLAEETVALASDQHYSIFFLGGFNNAGDKAAERLKEKYPGFVYKGCYCPPYGFEYEDEEKDKVIERINRAAPDIIIAGMGTPKTEIFLMENYQRMDAKVTLSVGAAIDFFAGNVKRCPEWINEIGMEWFYRFLKEPKRMFRRYFINDPKFLKLFFKYKPKKNK